MPVLTVVIILAVYAGGVAVDAVISYMQATKNSQEFDLPRFAVCFFWPIFVGAISVFFLIDAMKKEAERARSKV